MKLSVNKRQLHTIILSFLVILLMITAGCESVQQPLPSDKNPEAFVQSTIGSYDSADTAIIVSIDEEMSSLTFQNIETGKRYTLNYDGISCFYNRYGEAIAASQLKSAGVADICFRKSTKYLVELTLSSSYFESTQVSDYTFEKKGTRLSVGANQYIVDDFLVVASNDKTIEQVEINPCDVLTLYGNGHVINSIRIDKGHGYLRLDHDDYFIDGWIEVGQEVIRKIEDDMLLVVPEGNYQVLVSNDGVTGIKQVTIGRNQEVTVDLGDIDVEKKYGNILFVTDPTDALVYVDGEKTDTTAPMELEYGIHQLISRADGYETLMRYIKVGSPSASIALTLTASENKSDQSSEKSSEKSNESSEKSSESSEKSSEKTVESSEKSSESTSTPPTGSYTASEGQAIGTTDKVFINAPADVEVYVDGTYIGIAPISFKKTQGEILVTLRKSGYQSRTYTLEIDDEDGDVDYSFSGLDPIG